MRLPGVNGALADAIRVVNARFYAIPEAERPPPAPWSGLECEVDAACAAGDRERALAAVRAWRDRHVAELEGSAS